MAQKSYSLVLQKGIVGGFAPPTIDALYILTKEKESTDVTVQRQKRDTGKPSLAPLAPKKVPVAEADGLIDELHGILKEIPTESPPGSEDIYGLDTGIFWESDGFQWINGGPGGCSGVKSTVQATDEHKAKFKRAVEIVHKLAQ